MPDDAHELRRLAYSTLEIKSIDEDARTFEGIASTPSVDAGGDIMEPFGAQFSLPMPLFWQHGKQDIKDPVGWVTHATPTKDGIFVKGAFAKIDSPASLKDQLDRVWALVKGKLVRGLSIGWRPIEGKPEKGGVIRWLKWAWVELSAVAIPMNAEATIQTIKSLDRATRAASGPSNRPGASGQSPRSNTMSGITERRSELETKSEEVKGRMTALSQQCEGDVTKLSVEELKEFDALNAELGPLETDISRYRGMERAASKSTPVDPGYDPERSTRVRNGDFKMKSNLPVGTMFTRVVIAKARAIKAHASMADAAEFARKEWTDTPEVALYLKANPGTGLSGNWAENLNVVNTIEGEFLQALRPATIIGRLSLRPSAFNVKRIVQNAGATAGWVGRAVAKPVGEGDYDTVQVDQAKIAGMVVLTDDQIMSSVIDSVEATRQDLIGQIAQFADEQFTNPTVTAVANVNPASVTNTADDVPASGTDAAALRLDMYNMLKRFNAASIPVSNVAILMGTNNAAGLAMMFNSLGQREFPDLNIDGGSLPGGFKVIVSDNVYGDSSSGLVIAVKQSEVFLAQNGGVRVDMSRDATIDMAGGNSPTYSLFQKNSVALRAEWWVSWKKARAEAVQYISGAAYAPS